MRKRKPKLVSSDLVEHIGLLFSLGVETYLSRGLINEVACPNDRARLYKLVRELEGRHSG